MIDIKMGRLEIATLIDQFSYFQQEVVAPSNHSDFQRAPTWNDAVDIIENFPPADVRPVVRGKWIPVTNGRGGSECNLCHAYAPSYQSGAEYNSPFCPNCGADMRGDDG